MNHLIATITPEVLNILEPLILAALGWLVVRAATYIKAHTKNLQVQGVLLRLDDAVGTAVANLEQTTVLAAKQAAADGQLTAGDGAAIKAAALAAIKSHLGAKGIAELRTILGIKAEDLDARLGARIEAAVLQLPVKTVVAPARPLEVPVVQQPRGLAVPTAFANNENAKTPVLLKPIKAPPQDPTG